jgi:hypothetical protein
VCVVCVVVTAFYFKRLLYLNKCRVDGALCKYANLRAAADVSKAFDKLTKTHSERFAQNANICDTAHYANICDTAHRS